MQTCCEQPKLASRRDGPLRGSGTTRVSRYDFLHSGARGGFDRRFKAEAERCIRRIAEHPTQYAVRAGGYRRVFPYFIPFIAKQGTLWVLAIAHARRDPLYWIDRIRGIE